VTRREILKYGSMAGGALLAASKGGLPRLYANATQSPATTPFRDPLPAPPAPMAVAPFTLDQGALDDIARLESAGVPKGTVIANYYKLVAEKRSVYSHKDFEDRGLKTSIWGYKDANVPVWDFAPGPTFNAFINSGDAVRLTNNLDPLDPGFGFPQLTMHQHGSHLPFRSDGFAGSAPYNGATFNPVAAPGGGHYDYTYPLLDPGFMSDPRGGDITERPSTLWYHDHILDFTGPNVYKGLAGFFRVFDELDAADETKGLRLPYGDTSQGDAGQFDVPMVIQDKTFAADASLVFDPFNHDGLLGDKFLVNGKIQPYLDVQGHRYRFRFLNGSNARFYELFLTNAAGKHFPWTVIATEGGLLDHAVSVDSLLISPALRFDVIVDFSLFPQGEKLYLENRLVQDEGRGPKGTFEQPETVASGVRLVEFRVGAKITDKSQNIQPGMTLRHFTAIASRELSQATRREFVFERSHGAWVINGQLVDLNSPMAQPAINGPEIWHLKNSSGGWWHPIHIHSEFHRVLSRNGNSPSPYVLEQDGVAKKDTVILGPNSEVEIYFKFRDYTGPFVFHCHNIEHEDMAMMARFDVAPSPGQNSI